MSFERVRCRVIFHGRVQGVFFRAHAKRFAEELSLVGTVENLSNGTVALTVEGKRESVDRLIARLAGEEGPGSVKRMEREDGVATGEFTTFEVL